MPVNDVCRTTREENIAEFELSTKNYPPLLFSHVKSFAAIAFAPLRWTQYYPVLMIVTEKCTETHCASFMHTDAVSVQ